MTLIAAGVSFRYPGSEGFALEAVDLTIHEGTITALVGPSGSGKTTLAHLLAGLLAPDTGALTCDGQTIIRRRGRLPGHTSLMDQDPLASADPRTTLRRMIALPARWRRVTVDVDVLATEVALDPSRLDRRPHQVSGGQLQRACLARALAQQPRYLIADEPTSHLDPESTRVITGVLRARADRGLGVLVVTHDARLAVEWADELIVRG